MDDKKPGWKKFQNVTFDSKKFAKRARKTEGATLRHARKFLVRRVDSMREVQRHIVIWLLIVGCLIVSVGIQLIWFQRGYIGVAADEGGAYAEALLGPIDTLNPLYASSPAEVAVSKLMFSSLYDYDSTGHLRGNVATSITLSPKGDVYTVTLNPKVRWHDGKKLTASDVAFTLNLIKDPASRSGLRTTWQDVKVKAVNDETVEFTLPSAYASFPHALTFSILPAHILRNVAAGSIRESPFSLQPVGSGPFELRLLQTVSSLPSHKIAYLRAFQDYYMGAANLGRFELHVYDSPDTIAAALRTGEVNAAIDSGNIVNFKADNKFVVSSHPINSGVYALFNTTQPIIKDIQVRRALQLAISTDMIRKELASSAEAFDLPFMKGQVSGVMPTVQPYSPTKAAEILDTAGWKLNGETRQKDGQNLILNVVTTKGSDYERALQQLAGQWRKIGVDVQTTVVDRKDPTQNFVQNVLQPRNYDVLINELTVGADPDVYAYWHSSQVGKSGLNLSNYNSVVADDALAGARSRNEPALRDLKYITFAKQWLDDVPAIGLYQSTMSYVHTKKTASLVGDHAFIAPQDRYENILYWSAGRKLVYNTP